MALFDAFPDVQRALEEAIWEAAPDKPSAREAVRLQRRVLEESFSRSEGRTLFNPLALPSLVSRECLAPLALAVQAAEALARRLPAGSPASNLLNGHVNLLLSAVTLIDRQVNKPAVGRSALAYRQLISNLAELRDVGEWVQAVVAELRDIRLDDLDTPLADNTRYFVMSVAAVLSDPGNPLGTRPPPMSKDDLPRWRDYARQLADDYSPWLGLALLRALANPPGRAEAPPGELPPLLDWLREDLASLRDRCRGDEGARVPHSDSRLRILQVPEQDLRACDTTNLQRIFDELEAGPHARRLRGAICVTFPSVDNDPTPNYLIPKVRAFVAALHAGRPHFFYYLTPQRSAGIVVLHLFCMLPRERLAVGEGGSATPNMPLDEFVSFVAGHLLPAVRFCRAVDDDAAAFLTSIAPNFPADVWQPITADLRARDASPA